MAAPRALVRSDTFLEKFGTPIVLWRVLRLAGYEKAPCYTWEHEPPVGTIPWCTMKLYVPLHPSKHQWCGWVVKTDGQTPWEAIQVVALQMLMILS